MDLTRGRPGCR